MSNVNVWKRGLVERGVFWGYVGKQSRLLLIFVERLWLLILYIVISMCATFGQGSLMTGYFVVVTSFCRGGCWFCRTRTCLWDPVAKGCKMSFIRVGLWFYRTCIGKILVHDPIGGAELIVGVLQIEGPKLGWSLQNAKHYSNSPLPYVQNLSHWTILN